MKPYSHPRNDGSPSKRKFKGFNFYIQGNEKLSKKNRKRLLLESENHLGEVYHSINLSTEQKINLGLTDELDSNLNDIELLDQWNHMYDNYGYLMSEFRKNWENEKIGKIPPLKEPSIIQTLISKIESLENQVESIQKRLNEIETTSPTSGSIGF
jgi:chaperonin cofactor prefoldin